MKILKLLFICSTELQLFNALNLKLHLFPNDSSDIVIQFLKNDTVDFYNRLRVTGLFENVCYRLPDAFGFHAYAKKIWDGDFSASAIKAAKGSAKKLVSGFSSRRNQNYIKHIKDYVYNIETLDFSSYHAIFAGGSNEIVTNILKFVHIKYPHCKICLYEEGLSSYFNDELGYHCEDIKKDKIYLYRPEMALYQHPAFAQIPRINRNDNSFIEIANKVFNYKPKELEIRNKIIFLDNRVEPMPSYLTKSELLSKTLLRNPYKKHLRDHQTYVQQLQAFMTLVKYAGNREILVKLHPRTERKRIEEDYSGANTKIFSGLSVPWELFCCNCKMHENIFITTVSSAMQSNMFVMDEEDTNAFVILCKYAEFDLMNDTVFRERYQDFYDRIRKKKKDHQVYLPANEEEYIALLNRLLQKEAQQ